MMTLRRTGILAAVLLIAFSALARVDRVEITSRADVLNGRPFGTVGAYEKLAGRVYFKVNPDDAHNRRIVDVENAATNAQGEVEFSADVYILRPKDVKKGNGALLLEVPNRGGKGLLRIINGGTGSPDPTRESDFGDGWLMRHGYTVAWLGWQWDVAEDPGSMRLYAPVAYDEWWPKHLQGLLRDDFTLSEKRFDMPLGHLITGRIGGTEYPVTFMQDPRNVLTVRDTPTGQRRIIPQTEWSFAHEVAGKLQASKHHIHLNSGFEPGKIYELVYTVSDPVVAGLGLAAVRDFVSYEKNDRQAIAPVDRAYALGISQTGRFLRHFIWQGFNADEQNRRVLDGVLSHVAGAGRGSFNHRFAQPSRDAQPMSSIFYPTDVFPFTDLPETDPLTGETAGLQCGDGAVPRPENSDKCTGIPAKLAAKIFYSNTSYEYWGRAGSLIHTALSGQRAGSAQEFSSESRQPSPSESNQLSMSGRQPSAVANPSTTTDRIVCTTEGCVQDATLPDNVRIYLLAGLQHFSGPFPPEYGKGDLQGQQLQNPNPVRWLWRAMITNMDAWVRDGVEPPASNYPHISDDTLVALEKLAFPRIPAAVGSAPHSGVVAPGSSPGGPGFITAPSNFNQAFRLDFGPEWNHGIITNQPPIVGHAFTVLVPQVDADGNDRAGVHIPEMSVPLATYTGWNLRSPAIGAPEQRVSFIGSYIPFAKTAADRQKSGDLRLSIAERYKSPEDYLARYRQAAERLVKDRWLLQEDMPAVMERGTQEWDEATKR